MSEFGCSAAESYPLSESLQAYNISKRICECFHELITSGKNISPEAGLFIFIPQGPDLK